MKINRTRTISDVILCPCGHLTLGFSQKLFTLHNSRTYFCSKSTPLCTQPPWLKVA
jgi:hypothetical protein